MNFRDEFDDFKIEFFNPSKNQYPIVDLWTETTKVNDYLKQVRMEAIEELKNGQEETLEYYKLNSWRFKSNEMNIDELRSVLANKMF